MDLEAFRRIADQLDGEIAAVLAKYGLKRQKRDAKVDPYTGIIKYNLVLHDTGLKDSNGEQTTPEVVLWKQWAEFYCLPVDALNKKFMLEGRQYSIMGLKAGRAKKNVIVTRHGDGKRFVMTPEGVNRCLKASSA